MKRWALAFTRVDNAVMVLGVGVASSTALDYSVLCQ